MNQTVLNVLVIIIVLTTIWTVFNLLDNLFEFVSKLFKKERLLK